MNAQLREPAKANRLRPAQAAAKPALSTPVARKPAAKRRASRRASKAAPTTSSAPKPASKVTNREWGVFRKDTKNPKATKEDVARAMADPAIRWSLKEALRRKQTAGA
ncbi:MAG: hypothetical protein HY303_14720 [Candidatus Wallbacteria bacterium]|nr:hypothetical protein [Candidatus Wallbacteria bacterium]